MSSSAISLHSAMFPTQGSFSNNIDGDSQCPQLREASNILCNITGMYCYKTEFQNFTLTANFLMKRAGIPVDAKSVLCKNTTKGGLCPLQFYCSTPHAKMICPPRYYCALGFAQPRLCAFSMLSCPSQGMAEPSTFSLFLIFFVFIVIFLNLYRMVVGRDILHKELKYKSFGTSFLDKFTHERPVQNLQ